MASGVLPIPEALAKAPGPSPWYLRGKTLSSERGDLRWESGTQPDGGATELRDPAGAILARCGFYCYVLPLEGTSFLVWTLQKQSVAQTMRFWVVDTARLKPLDADLVPPSVIQINASDVSEAGIPASLPEGIHRVALLPGLASPKELLMWVHLDDSSDRPLKLWSVKPGASELAVFQQSWFGSATYDLGYQWPTRVARDPDSGRVVGEGI